MAKPIPIIAAAILLAALPTPSSASTHPTSFAPYSVTSGTHTAHGFLAYPTDVTPTTLLVIAHGCCIALNPTGWSAAYANSYYRMTAWAANYGVAVVGMNYTGAGHWDVAAGAQDTIAATQDLKARWPITRTVIWGVSMGGEVSGMAIAQAPAGTFDYWVDQYGVSNLLEEFLAIGSIGLFPKGVSDPTALGSPWILDETGGLPVAQVPLSEWTSRSPALLATQMHLGHAYIVHGIGDPVVPVSQGIEMHAALVAAGIPSTLRLVLTGASADGGVQLPFTPFTGVTTIPTPDGRGPAAHNTLGAAEAFLIVGQLLGGTVPDSGFTDTVTVVDYHACFVLAIADPSLSCHISVHP